MDKLKNMLHPGKKEEDEVLYGSGHSADPVHSGSAGHATGQGSHIGNPSSGQRYGTDGPVGSSATGTTSASSGHGTGNASYTSRSLMPGEFPDDNASIASIKSGVHGSNPGSKLTDSSAIGSDSGLDVNKPLPHTPASGGVGSSSGLTGSNLPDRSVGGPGHSTAGGENLSGGRSFPLGGQSGATHGSGLTGSNFSATSGQPSSTGLTEHERHGHGTTSSTAGPHSSNLANRADPRIDSDLDGSRTAGMTGYEPSTTGHGSTTGASTSTPSQHGHLGYGHMYEGDPCPPGEHHNVLTTGPHSVDAANLLDPHVPRESLHAVGTEHAGTGLASGTSGIGIGSAATGNSTSTYGSTPSTAGPHSSNLANKADPRVDSDRDGSNMTGSTSGLGYGSTSTTAGPHSSSLANKADPRVDSDRDGSRFASSTASPGYGTSARDIGPEGARGDHQYGRDAGLAGVGAAGAEGNRSGLGAPHIGSGVPPTGSTGVSSDHRNPYSSSGLDPRVDSTPRSTETGSSGGHHLGRDAGIVGGAGVVGSGAYEASKHHGTHQPNTTSATGTSGYGPSGTTVPSSGIPTSAQPGLSSQAHSAQTGDRHLGRDAGIVGGAGVLGAGAYEAGKHQGSHQPTSNTTSATSGYPSTTSGVDDRSRTGDHHLGRDVGIVGGAGALGTGAYEADKHPSSHQPSSTSTTGTSSHVPGTSGYDDRSRTAGDHHGRDTAAAATAGAIGGGAAGGEFSKVEAEKREKELAKERAHHEKELHKAEKAHQKDVAKHEKAHEKEIAKHEHHHDKDLSKHDKKHEKELTEIEKHERAKEHDREAAHGEKKHGGLFGFLHRDKPDPELKEEEAARQERLHGSGHGTGPAAGVATGVAAHEHEHEGRNRLHKDPPADFVARANEGQGASYGEAPKSGYASQVTGGTGTSALSQGTAPLGNTTGTGHGSNVVIEPHTGLPMDLSKGDGRGGTDANPIPGYHDHSSSGTRH